ncbi:unnamed protein product [Trifolium pratense]|uniref:Uncharacterized protein n=1 Tax=Trifolium pratense TaxID=57577 RepID=A0ACB0JX44_TRIPR|nr:unnamed protein product [Trifolium pratense]
MLTCTEHLENLQNWTLDQRIKTRLEDTRFTHLSELAKCQHDNQLLECVVSHFYSETCGFEFGDIELVFGLKDVFNITCKPVNGIDGNTAFWSDKCVGQDLTFKKQSATRGAIKLSVLREKFMEVPPNATQVELDRHARAYALYVLGSSLFSSSCKADVDTLYLPLLYHVEEIKDYVWGAAALAHLYISMKNINEVGIKHMHGIALSLQVNYNPYDNLQFPDLKAYSTFELERRVFCISPLEQIYLINFNEVAFFQPHKFKKQYSNARAGNRRRPKWKLYLRSGRKGKNWQEVKSHKKYINLSNNSWLHERPQPEERLPERVQGVPVEEPIEVEHHNLDGEEWQPERVQGVPEGEPIEVEHHNLDDGIIPERVQDVLMEEQLRWNTRIWMMSWTIKRSIVEGKEKVYRVQKKVNGCIEDAGDNNEDAKTNQDMKVDDELSLYLLKELLPYLKQLSQKEMTEIEIEASNQGLSLSKLSISKLDDLDGERLYCDNCKTSIFALHKHCQTCECDFCIACCHDFCDAQLRDGADPIESCVTAKPGVHKHPRSDRHEDSDDRVCCDGFLELRVS